MNTLQANIATAVAGEYTSVGRFTNAILEGFSLEDDSAEDRIASQLANEIHAWATNRDYLVKALENSSREALRLVEQIKTNYTINISTDWRIAEYHEQCTVNEKVISNLCYVAGVNRDQVQAIFATVTKIRF